jgi:iron complex outermembrane receptor protein
MINSKIAAAVVAALTLNYGSVYAQSLQTDQTDTSQQSGDQAANKAKAKKLQAVTVTGSLIPQSQIETAQPVITITAQDIKAKGFTTVAEALQSTSFAVGSVQGQQNTNSFTTGAETLSLFGLPVGFTKYLIDGRPMGNFPGLYNGSDTFNSISGIPADLVDRIDILPGGQSSLYGSDAIAGVINIVLKKHVDAPSLDVRYGWSKDGGGADRRISFANSFNIGKFNSLVGVQFESTQPLWTRDRSLTSHYFEQGTSPAVANRDSVVVNSGGADPAGYLFLDPSNCANASGLFNGTEVKSTRAGRGDYCGSLQAPGNSTTKSGTKTANFYTHNTFDVSDHLQLYGDLLYNYEEQKYTDGTSTSFWTSGLYAAPGGYFFDDQKQDLVDLVHVFSPEEVGGYAHNMNSQTENSYMLTLGGKGTFGASNWEYDLGFTHSDDHLINRNFQRFTAPLEAYYEKNVLGPQLGISDGYPVFNPNYANLYKPVSPADYRSFTGYTDDRAKTWDNLVRGQLTNASLFSLPGGDAGVAVVVEGGNEGWNSSPDPRLLETITDVYGNTDPAVWGTSAVPGAGHRSRQAATTEFRFPLLKQLTLDVSGRYDKYNVSPQDFSHTTYNIGLEYRPFDTLLLRGRYGTAFKAPTLSDEFQGQSGYFSSVSDYLNCGRLGFNPVDISQCPTPYDSEQFKGLTHGNPALKPITAKVWSYGVVWAPIDRMSVSVDYLHFDINNEVAQLSADQLSNTEYLCDIGTLDKNSSTCAQAFSLITRSAGGKTVDVNGVPTQLVGPIIGVATPKLNVANEQVNALTAAFNYAHEFAGFGTLSYSMSYSDELKHTYQDFVTDPKLDELRHPNFSTDFKTKVNASLTWSKGDWSATGYVNRYGRTPNYLARINDNYSAEGTGKLGTWILYNASVTYSPAKNLGLSFLVNNVFNKMPPLDRSYPGTTATPYNTLDYNVYGRAMFLEADYKFATN